MKEPFSHDRRHASTAGRQAHEHDRLVLFVGCALLVLAAGAWWVMRYPGFAIARIVVHG